jgi:FtsZ-binding cell division protein ZapB
MAAEPAVDVGAELRQMDADTLKAMHARLGATVKHLEESLQVTEEENTQLRAEIQQNKATIDTLLGSLGQLKIGGRNTPAPVINGETAAMKVERFVRRTVESVAPKQTGVQVSERVGELKEAEEPAALRAAVQVKDQVASAWGMGKSLLGQMFQPQPAPKQRNRVAGKAKQRAKAPAAVPAGGYPAEELVPDASLAELDPTADAAKQEAERWADTVEATLLLEVKIDLGDGHEETLSVRAADRLGEVAARFVEEHALKKQFLPPLIAFLRQVEDDADTFPVSTTAKLSEIFETHAE